jgi:hypothetical protein
MSGVDSLIKKGIADPSRLGAMGWSQGGYISAFLTTHTDRFKAISVGAGISDWMTYYVSGHHSVYAPVPSCHAGFCVGPSWGACTSPIGSDIQRSRKRCKRATAGALMYSNAESWGLPH